MSQQVIRVDLRPIQKQNLETLRSRFGLSDAELNRCLFFSKDQDEPWIPPDLLEAIARQTGGFQAINATYDKFIPELNQVVYTGMVEDQQGRVFMRSGVATIGERPGDAEIDEHTLAKGRGLSGALTGAGFNPFKAGTVVEMSLELSPRTGGERLPDLQRDLDQVTEAAAVRIKDLRAIHAEAEKRQLIKGKDMSGYRAWLFEKFGVHTAAHMDEQDRARVINALQQIDPEVYRNDTPIQSYAELEAIA